MTTFIKLTNEQLENFKHLIHVVGGQFAAQDLWRQLGQFSDGNLVVIEDRTGAYIGHTDSPTLFYEYRCDPFVPAAPKRPPHGLALDSGEFIPAEELNRQPAPATQQAGRIAELEDVLRAVDQLFDQTGELAVPDGVRWGKVAGYVKDALAGTHSPTAQTASRPTSIAGPMQFGGCPDCGSRNCVARECTRTVSHKAQAGAVPLSGIGLAAIGRRHFGNPIPQEWYAAARDLEAAHGIKVGQQ